MINRDVLACMCAVTMVCAAAVSQAADPVDTWRYPVTVLRVIDGGTIDATMEVGLNLTYHGKIRLLGLKAYELKDPGGPAAKIALEERLKACQYIDGVTARGKDFDAFGRVLARLTCDEKDIADEMVKAGHGVSK